jgi:hypothetical protein
MLTEGLIAFPVEECAENIDEHASDGRNCSIVAFAFPILETSIDGLAKERCSVNMQIVHKR